MQPAASFSLLWRVGAMYGTVSVDPMSNSFQREAAIFKEAAGLPQDKRAVYLDEACAGDAVLRRRVEELLQADNEAGGFLPDVALGGQRQTYAEALLNIPPEVPHSGEKIGDRIGQYKLLQQLGEGGCGVVYMAEQEKPVRRRVALKIIKLGMDTKQVIARFEAERQALALMDHPNIARIFDAGVTDVRQSDEQPSSLAIHPLPLVTYSGRPFFVMELVRGTKITDYCDEHQLTTTERLGLFIQVCQAIQHAHQKGIIHRDIKPSNILVTVNDAVAVPKVIDFGIAKATQGRLTDQTLFTAFEQFIGTPTYMSPEQATLTSLDVDTRSDVYSLGVLLYELLTSRTPFEQKALLASGLDEMRRTIREREPPRPSTRLTMMQQSELTTAANRRQLEPLKLIHLLRGDLDWIVMKCLEKDRAHRYDTANGLATDLQRYLADEPVVARPPGRLYRFRKLVRRNKVVFAASGTAAAALVVGLVVSMWLLFSETVARREAVAARNQAITEMRKSMQSVELMRELLHRLFGKDHDTTQLTNALERLVWQVTPDLKKKPELQQNLYSTMALLYLDFDEEQKAEEMALKGIAILRAEAGKARSISAEPLRVLRDILMNEHKYADARALFEGSLPTELGLRPESAELLRIRGDWWARTGDWQAAIADFSKLITLEPEDHEGYYSLAPLLVQAGELPAYRHFCGQMLRRFRTKTDDSNMENRIARVCLMLPDSGTNLTAAAELADDSLESGEGRINEAFCQFAKGLADYRRDRYPSAVHWMKTVQAQKPVAGQGYRRHLILQSYAVLAMAKYRLGDAQKARAALASAAGIIQEEIELADRGGGGRGEHHAALGILEQKTPTLAHGDLTDWREWVIAYTLFKEAKALVPPANAVDSVPSR